MADAAALAHANPDVLIILNHAGMPVDRNEEGIRLWRRGMQELAAAANVVVKISGLGTVDLELDGRKHPTLCPAND